MSAQLNVDSLSSIFDNLQIKSPSKRLQIKQESEKPLLVQKNPKILSDLLGALNSQEHATWATTDFTNKVGRLTKLEKHTIEYRRIKMLFDNSMRKPYSVCKIKRVENPYLFVQYNLKKLKKQCSERQLFHGTTESSIKAICRENFNWRLAGTSVGHRFGRGVSFSPESNYSSYYPRNYFLPRRIMFVADVLIKSTCIGDPSMTIPIESCDTSVKPDGKVVVKYEDNDFYPKYVIYYK
ncbi:poly [ADP-ribose] polymerase 12-like [Anoplophora glabripennis]|uniref:poly [ADP-ribose] polymerase 12-like n=1 Tax=Anoplophora glabripennis TaxID=217634 RepID=UPI00087477B9|nr:poly [ADP-ribose] polymerase 12-like [Anoplophora glabripennis]